MLIIVNGKSKKQKINFRVQIFLDKIKIKNENLIFGISWCTIIYKKKITLNKLFLKLLFIF